MRLNLHGVVSLESVQQVEDEEYEEVVKKRVPNPAAAKADAAPKVRLAAIGQAGKQAIRRSAE